MNDYKKGDYVLYWDPQFFFGDNVVVRGTTGSDKMRINDSYNTVYSGAGSDVVTICNADNALVYGEAGNDFIGTNAFSRNPTIYGGKGNDTIRFLVSRTYADGGENDDLFIPLNSITNSTMIGGAGNDTFWFIESSTVTASGGSGNNLYRFDPYYLFGPYHNNVVITDLSSNDTIRHEESASDGTELSISEKNGDIIINDDDYGIFTITLKGGASQKSDIANVTYQAKNWSGKLQELFPDFFEGGGEYVSINSAETAAKILEGYDEETFDAADYSKLVTIDATEAAIDLEIIGNAKNNKIFGSENNDTLYGGKGTDTLTGNGGADTFWIVKGEGNKVIADYTEGEDVIFVEGADVDTVIDSASVKSGNVIFKVGSNNVTVKGGDGQEIWFVDEDGNEYTYPNDPDEETVIFNAASTSATITAYYDEGTFDAADYSKLVTIDATEAEIDLEILGNAKNNKIFGSENNDTLYGGKGTDTLQGNGGEDTFWIVKGEGNKVIADYTEGEDVIYVEGADVDTVIDSASVKSGNVIFKVGSGKITVKGGDGQEILFIDEDGNEYTYPPDDETVIFNAASTSATVTAYFEDETFDAADYSKLVTIDATEAEIDLEILGNAKNNKIFGSENNDTLYGGKGTDTLTGNGGEDTFWIVKGEGAKVIADYTEGEDVIFVESADVEDVIDSASVKSGNVIFKVGSNNVTVKGGDGQEILFVDEDGNEYTYPNEPDEETVIFNAASTSATITAYYDEGTFDAADYSKLVTIDATEAEIDLEILGNAKNNKIYGSENNDTLYGGKGTDTLTGNGGEDTFWIVKGEGNKVIADYTEGEDVIYVEGADVEDVIDSASIKSGNVIFKVGTNNVSVKGGSGQEILFVDENGDEYTYGGGAVKGSSKLWFTDDDNNFITDTPQIDSISEAKYSVGTITKNYLETFAQDKQELQIVSSDK